MLCPGGVEDVVMVSWWCCLGKVANVVILVLRGGAEILSGRAQKKWVWDGIEKKILMIVMGRFECTNV